ncbi:response regulator [Exilibacterium tricleocarpae]|uniref:Response regulator n=1 Tax=Exilibacterium tricleocarpae TaxID=2591008 RepID=A0A545TZF6_9GAMM|nr:response regulator [Exilibacterium tricleocarpae]TQV82599.1 response regulator [Exilibacterium tricleocarpae]
MSLKILVVDDATFIRDMVKKHLRSRIPGVQVADAIDGNRAVALLKAQAVDLILSDWEMPGMSGEELLRWVRDSDKHSTTPFVMVTSRGDRDHVVKAVEAGVSDFISKPFTPEELLKKVFKQLKKIGKLPGGKAGAAGGGSAPGSLEALTGAKPAARKASGGAAAAVSSADLLTGGKPAGRPAPAAAASGGSSAGLLTGNKPGAKAASPAAKGGAKTQAELRFPQGTRPCVVKDLSLQAMSGLIQRSDEIPTVFDQAVVDIQMDTGEVARVNGYVHSLQAGENRVDCNVVKIVIRFVDNDPAKFEVLSQFIART